MKKQPHDNLPSTFSAVAQASRLVRRKASPMALEQRFMFDGAAFVEATAVLAADPQQAPAQESAAFDGALTSALSADTDATTDIRPHADGPSLFTLVEDGDGGPSGKLGQGVAAAEQTLLGWAGSAGAVADVGVIFAPQDSGLGTADGRVAQVLEGIRSGDISVSLELRDPRDLLGSMGAFAASGPGGTPVIYLNRDWVESANTTREAIAAVLLEEYGHYLDSMLNQGGDAAGDEGEAFANCLLEESTSEADRQRIAAESDAVVVWLEGQKVHLELASLLFSKAAYFAEDSAEPGSGLADLEGNSLTLLAKVNQADGATQFLFNSDPESALVYSGNNVQGTLYAIDADGLVVGSYYGEISRLVKSGSTVYAGQFFVYPNGDNTATGDPSTTILIDFGTGGAFSTGQAIRTSSDPVDTALNNLLLQPISPEAMADDGIAHESGGTANASAPANASPTGNLLTNDVQPAADTDANDNYVSEVKTASDPSVANPVGSVEYTTSEGVVETWGAKLQGLHGDLYVSADGSYRYVVNDNDPQVQALKTTADTLTDAFQYKVSNAQTMGDSNWAELTITIKGSNDAPVASDDQAYAREAVGTPAADPAGNAEGNVLTNDTDVDAGDTKRVVDVTAIDITSPTAIQISDGGTAIPGKYGKLTMGPDGTYTYSVNNSHPDVNALGSNATLLESFTYTVTDAGGLTHTAILTITILGVDDGLSVSTVTVNEGSPYAVFTVTGTPGQATYLSLDNEQTTGLNRLEYHDPNGIEANANGWVLYTSGTVNLDANGELLVRVAIGPEQEDMLDSPETFRLIATNVNGIESAFDDGIGTILDDGTGDYFADDNIDGVSVVPEGVTLDDDSPGMTIAPVTVEEGSTAVFNVTVTAAEAPYTVTFATSLSSQSAEADDIGALVVKDNTGQVIEPNQDGSYTVPAGTTALTVEVPTNDDDVYEGSETFLLTGKTEFMASNTSAAGTILDDGSGKVYDDSGTDSGVTPDNDRLVPTPVAESAAVDAPPAVVLVPEASTPREPLRFDSTTFVALPSDQQPQLSVEVLALVQRGSMETEVPRLLTQATGFQVLVNERQSGQLELNRTIDKQFVEAGAQGGISLPYDTFTHSDPNARITLTANLSDGRPLPKWVSFEARTGTFTVQAPAGYVGDLEVEVSARDDKGNEVKTKFKLTVGAKAAVTGREGLSDQLRQASKSAFVWRDLVRIEPAAAPARESAPTQRVPRVVA